MFITQFKKMFKHYQSVWNFVQNYIFFGEKVEFSAAIIGIFNTQNKRFDQKIRATACTMSGARSAFVTEGMFPQTLY